MTTIHLALTALAWGGLALALLYAFVTLMNLAVFRAPREDRGDPTPRVSVLIPARDEAANIEAAVRAALMQDRAEVEVVVLDDGSTDGTGDIVRRLAEGDPRVRLARGGDLPSDWNGKQHACHRLSTEARMPVWLFVDADVRLERDAVARMHAHLAREGLDLVSGFPRQITGTLAEKVTIPQILVLLLGYLPFPFARLSNSVGFAAGCGQLMMVTAEGYRASGGHAGFRRSMHDGLHLPRAIRRSDGRTDIVDGTPVASCRMYDNWDDIWAGFTKNATEGMAKPVALPIWTVLLAGGHLLPWATLILSNLAGAERAASLSLAAIAAVLLARLLLALKVRQSLLSVLLHPVGVAVTLAIQWSALKAARRGEPATWRGRAYDVN